MKLFNIELEAFAEFLLSLELGGRESRMRTRFMKILQEQMTVINEEYQLLVQQFTRKDENGEPILIELEGGRKIYDIPDESKPNLQSDYQMLLMEEFIIDETEERQLMLETVRDAVLDCNLKFKGKEAMKYDRFCEIVESIEYK